jgi:L-threonylcarbamoyladenylate synthase
MKHNVSAPPMDPALLETAAALLRSGGLVAFPTETVYGLGAVAFNETAVARIFEAKQRPRFDPLIVHVCEPDQLSRLCASVPAAARTLIDRFWPGPLTLVLPKALGVPDLVTAGLPTVAVRMPRHPLALELIRRTGAPLAAPSANPFGHVSPTTAQHVLDHLAGKVDLVLDGGPCPVGVESTIVSFASGSPALLRHGGLPLEEIEALLGPLAAATAQETAAPSAPGMLPQHYAPRTRLQLVSGPIPPPLQRTLRLGALAFQAVSSPGSFAAIEVLSAQGDLREAATRLFGAMRRLDEQHLDLIWAERVPDVGLGRAINDRLRRAAGQG